MPMPTTSAVLLIAHGSRHDPANDDLRAMAAELAGRGDHPIVEPAFLELAAPDIPAAGARCVARGASRVLMVPYFLSAGVHLVRDLTAARDALRASHPGVEFLLGPPLGPHPMLTALVVERVRRLETEGPPPDIDSPSAMAERYAPMGGHGEGGPPVAVAIDEDRATG